MYNNYSPVVSPFFVFSQIVVKFAINKIVATVLQNTKIQEVDRGSFMYNLQLSVDLPPIGLSIAYFLNNKKNIVWGRETCSYSKYNYKYICVFTLFQFYIMPTKACLNGNSFFYLFCSKCLSQIASRFISMKLD
jgi:hypothetical protein